MEEVKFKISVLYLKLELEFNKEIAFNLYNLHFNTIEKISYFSNTLRFLHKSIQSSLFKTLTSWSSHIEFSKLAISS